METLTKFIGIEILADGTISVLWDRQFVDDNGNVISKPDPHYVRMSPGSTLTSAKGAADGNMVAKGFPETASPEWAQVQAITDVVWTPEVITAYRDKLVAPE